MVMLVDPETPIPPFVDPLRKACEHGQASFFTSGIDPGFANDALPLVLTGLAEHWTHVRIQEIVNYATYAQPQVLFDTMGFGKPLDAKPILLMPGALGFAPTVGPAPDPQLAAGFVWLDALALNVDRTPRNPNLLTWHRRLYGIDHGAALYVHHRWSDATRDPGHARRPFPQVRDHVLLPFAGSIEEADARLAPLVTDDLLRELVEAVPTAWLDGDPGFASVDDNRAAYAHYLRRRLTAPRAFVEEAERARTDA